MSAVDDIKAGIAAIATNVVATKASSDATLTTVTQIDTDLTQLATDVQAAIAAGGSGGISPTDAAALLAQIQGLTTQSGDAVTSANAASSAATAADSQVKTLDTTVLTPGANVAATPHPAG